MRRRWMCMVSVAALGLTAGCWPESEDAEPASAPDGDTLTAQGDVDAAGESPMADAAPEVLMDATEVPTPDALPDGQGADTDICGLPLDPGPCLGAMERFGFSVVTGQCEAFTYGGCDGNANNFETLAACEAACMPDQTPASDATGGEDEVDVAAPVEDAAAADIGPAPDAAPTPDSDPAPDTAAEGVCGLPLVTGPCFAAIQVFGFNVVTGQCEPFIYGGCQGNANNFPTLAACEAACM